MRNLTTTRSKSVSLIFLYGKNALINDNLTIWPVSVGGYEGGDPASPGVAHGQVDHQIKVLVGQVVRHTHHLARHLVDILHKQANQSSICGYSMIYRISLWICLNKVRLNKIWSTKMIFLLSVVTTYTHGIFITNNVMDSYAFEHF